MPRQRWLNRCHTFMSSEKHRELLACLRYALFLIAVVHRSKASSSLGGADEVSGVEPHTRKAFVYLIQGHSTSEAISWLRNRSTASSDVIVLVWGEGSGGALCYDLGSPVFRLGSLLYRPNTTWNTGRNEMLREALRCSRNYMYFVFMDGDAELVESRDFGYNTGDPYLMYISGLLIAMGASSCVSRIFCRPRGDAGPRGCRHVQL